KCDDERCGGVRIVRKMGEIVLANRGQVGGKFTPLRLTPPGTPLVTTAEEESIQVRVLVRPDDLNRDRRMDHANRGTGQVQPCPNFGPQLLVGIAGYCLVKVVFAGKVAVDVGASQSSTLGDLP